MVDMSQKKEFVDSLVSKTKYSIQKVFIFSYKQLTFSLKNVTLI